MKIIIIIIFWWISQKINRFKLQELVFAYIKLVRLIKSNQLGIFIGNEIIPTSMSKLTLTTNQLS